MSELGSGSGTSYPTSLDNDNIQEVNSPAANKTRARAEVANDLAAAIIAIETELGTGPKGTAANVKTFLQTQHNLDGTHKGITTDTLSVTGTTYLPGGIYGTGVLGSVALTVNDTANQSGSGIRFIGNGGGGLGKKVIRARGGNFEIVNSAEDEVIVAVDDSGNITAPSFAGNLTGGVNDGINIIHTKIINIGVWNMDATDSVSVNHGVTFSKIRDMQISIYSDVSSFLIPLTACSAVGVVGAYYQAGATQIVMSRIAGGIFDNTDYNDGAINRGFIVLKYVE